MALSLLGTKPPMNSSWPLTIRDGSSSKPSIRPVECAWLSLELPSVADNKNQRGRRRHVRRIVVGGAQHGCERRRVWGSTCQVLGFLTVWRGGDKRPFAARVRVNRDVVVLSCPLLSSRVLTLCHSFLRCFQHCLCFSFFFVSEFF